ncbi:MAG: hypothetical protein IPK77_12160 [Cellvibrio sp.]|nr:hypothetical protein [Cellvibrio sp.]
MKKIFIALMGFCSIFSINVWAVDGELTVYGYPAPTWSGLMSGFAAPVPQTFYSTTYSAEAYAQMKAAQAAAIAQARKECYQKAALSDEWCKVEAANTYSDRVYACSFNLFNDNAMSQCNFSAKVDNDANLQVCQFNKLSADTACSRI